MLPGGDVNGPDDTVGAVDVGSLPIYPGLPAWIVSIPQDDKARFGHVGGEFDVVEGVGSDGDGGLRD